MSNLDRLVTLERVGEVASPPGPGSYPFSPIARLDVDTISTTRRTAWAWRFDARLSRELVNMYGGRLPTHRAMYRLRDTEDVAVGD